MAILIPNETMPETCAECPCIYDGYCRAFQYNEDDEDFREVKTKDEDKKRRDDCPLVEIPDVYIDISKAFMTELCNKVCREEKDG
ncbi:MAG: hypothetical protein ILP16_10695 [Spirochaetales bacterium]|nr:hypothetical protein [Spirochaetales bacterium]